MTRLLIHVEGITEETFVNEVLSQYLCGIGYSTVSARLVGNTRHRDHRGGIRSWESMTNDIVSHLKEDHRCIVTTMVDYYALQEDWPNRPNARNLRLCDQKANLIEESMYKEICKKLKNNFNPNRFIPYIMMHEFEGMLFSDCEKFGRIIGYSQLISTLQDIRNQFPNPEEINDSPLTAPSKRIKKLIPEYEKPIYGNIAILEIGLNKIRSECPHFNEWLEKLRNAKAIS